jgi:hypothetical protein
LQDHDQPVAVALDTIAFLSPKPKNRLALWLDRSDCCRDAVITAKEKEL